MPLQQLIRSMARTCFERTTLPLALALALATWFLGCGGERAEVGTVPDGWESAEDRWWTADADTAEAFRDLSDLQEMGVASDAVYPSNRALAQEPSIRRDQLELAVKRSLIALFRNEPEVVDSLFERLAAPLLAEADLSGEPGDVIERQKKRAYDALRRHFREPATARQLGEDISVPYPDSLRASGVSGAVRMQVRLNEEGEPIAIRLIESVHPVLDAIAMRATTEMRWQPAYLRMGNRWQEIPAWSRFTIHFAAPGA